MPTPSAAELTDLVDDLAIRRVLYRYCRGIDRLDLEMVRACYHPDATDNHGDYSGGVDGFLEYVRGARAVYESTMHTLGNILIEIDGDVARSEAYALAQHRIPPRGRHPQRDNWVGLRYIDRFERRDDRQWRIAERICVYEWTRTDPVEPGWTFTGGFLRGVSGPSDPLYQMAVPPPH